MCAKKKISFNLSNHARDFLESSKINSYDYIDSALHINDLISNSSIFSEQSKHTSENGYQESKSLENNPLNKDASMLRRIHAMRKSTKIFSKTPLNFSQLSDILSNSYYIIDRGQNGTRYNIPSGGGIYSVDLFVINLQTEELSAGNYYYNPQKVRLELVQSFSKQDIWSKVSPVFFAENRSDIKFETASCIVVLVGSMNKVTLKYMDRGVRLSFIDAGALIYSLYLNCSHLNIGCTGNYGFSDDDLRDFLKLRGDDKCILGTVVLGNLT